MATLDPCGRVRRSWGLAAESPLLRTTDSLLTGPLGSLVEAALRGESGAVYHEGLRYCGGGGGETGQSFLLVLDAQEERQARQQASHSWRMANTLRRFGKALTSNQTVRPLSIAAAHEIASSTELAAALVWAVDPDSDSLDLVASVGVNRAGAKTLAHLSTEGSGGCVAELVASTQTPFTLDDVRNHLLTEELEARFCYLIPGGLAVYPLMISDRLLGVLELVGRQGDPHFEQNLELFETLAEHLALAVNSAQMFENLERLATRDPLTGIANHRTMQEFLHTRVTEADRNGQSVGAIMIDVDHFRLFNEEEGHHVGDAVLRAVADTIRGCLRPYDMAARYGGEEFCVIVPGASPESLQIAAERIRSRVESILVPGRNQRRHVTVSLGCAVYPENANDSSSLLRAADVALYRAKRAGRNRTLAFEGEYSGETREAGVSLEALASWLRDDERRVAEARLRRLAPEVDHIVQAMDLTASQRALLEGLIYIVQVRTVSTHDVDLRQRMERAEEFRVLLPILDALDEYFDGRGRRALAGSQIPLLSRILAVLLARDEGQDPDAEPGRYDPEIVALTRRPRRAA